MFLKEIPVFNQLADIFIQNILSVEKDQLGGYYSHWQENFDRPESNNFKMGGDLIHVHQKIPQESILRGIDLPIWFGDFSKKRIVVLGIDPLRSNEVFSDNSADPKRDVIIGAPYAFHEKKTREKDCKSYWTLVEGIKNAGNFVYCTDIFKTYYYREELKIRSYRDSDYVSNKYHREVLKQELGLIEPDVIIVLGQLAHCFLLDKKKCPKISQPILDTRSIYRINDKSVDAYTVFHLSKVPRGSDFKIFFKNNGIRTELVDVENRVQCAEKYLEIFKRHGII